MDIKNRKKIGFRMTVYCIVFAVFLSAIIGGLGVYTYYNNSRKHFEDYLESILAVTRASLDTDELERTILYAEQNAAYKKAQQQFNDIKDNTNIKYIYFLALKGTRQYEYIICGYDKKERKHPETLVQFKDIVKDEIDQNMIAEIIKVNEGKSDNLIILNRSELGYVMTFVIPVKNNQGKIIGVLAADISVDKMQDDVKSYVSSVLLGATVSLILFLFFFLLTIKRRIIHPIVLIGKQANEFVSQTDKNPSQMVVKEITVNTSDELELLARQLNSMMKDMVAYMSGLESMTALQERVNVQLDLARQIQQSMLPDHFPAFPERNEFDIYAIMQSAKEVGGEFYDFFMIDGTHLGVITADVSGEGVPAALFMMRCKTLFKNYTELGLEPAKVLFDANNELCEKNDSQMTVEAFIGILDVYSGEFIYANAGENIPYLVKTEGEVEVVNVEQGFLLGMLEGIPFYQEEIKLEKNDVLCLFTNGVYRMEKEGGEKLDMKKVISNHIEKRNSVQEMVEGIKEDVNRFLGGEENEEDLTVVVLKFDGYLL